MPVVTSSRPSMPANAAAKSAKAAARAELPILDELGLNQLGYDGAAFNTPGQALVSKPGQYTDVPYLVYTTANGFNADLLFSFLF